MTKKWWKSCGKMTVTNVIIFLIKWRWRWCQTPLKIKWRCQDDLAVSVNDAAPWSWIQKYTIRNSPASIQIVHLHQWEVVDPEAWKLWQRPEQPCYSWEQRLWPDLPSLYPELRPLQPWRLKIKYMSLGAKIIWIYLI